MSWLRLPTSCLPQARLPTSTTTMSPLDMYWLINCDGESPAGALLAPAEQLQSLPQPAQGQQLLGGEAASRQALQQLAATSSLSRQPAAAGSNSRGTLHRQNAFRIPYGSLESPDTPCLQPGSAEAGLTAESCLQAGAEQGSLEPAQLVVPPSSRHGDEGSGAGGQAL